MNWLGTIGAICAAVAGLLLTLALSRPRVCIRVADFFMRISWGGAFASIFGVGGLVAAKAVVNGAIVANYNSLAVGGVAAVDAVRSSLDQGIADWFGIAGLWFALTLVFMGALRISKMILHDQTERKAARRDNEGDGQQDG